MAKKTKVVDFDLYSLYDRMFDGCLAQVTVEYDDDTTNPVLTATGVTFNKIMAFLQGYPFDIERIEKEVLECEDYIEECFMDQIDDTLYDKLYPEV